MRAKKGTVQSCRVRAFLKSQRVAGRGGMAGGDVVHRVDRYIMQSPPVYKPLGLSVP